MTRDKGTGSVHKLANGKWRADLEAGWTTRGTRRRISVTASTKREALAKLKAKQRELAVSGTPAEGTRSTATIKAWMDQWLTEDAHRSRPSTHTANRSAARQWIIPTIGTVTLSKVSPSHVRAVARAPLDAGRTTATAHRTQAVLIKALRDALAEGCAIPLSALETTLTPAGASDRDAIPLDHALRILAVALTKPDATRWVAALLQGLRPAEALGLRWRAIDLESGTIDQSWQMKALPYNVARDRSSGFKVPDGYETIRLEGRWHLARPKTAAGKRVYPLPPGVADMLAAWQAIAPVSKHGLVWPAPDGGPRDDKVDRAAWRDICAEAGVERELEDGTTRPYALYEARHTTATLLRVIGADDETITELLGHSSILSSKAYLHTDTTRTRAALARVADVLQLTSI